MRTFSNIKTDWTDVDWEIPRICEHKQYDPSFLKEILEHSKLYGETIKVNKHNLIYPNQTDSPFFIFIPESKSLRFKTGHFWGKNAYDEPLVREYIINKLRLERFSESSLEFMKLITVNPSSSGNLEVLGFLIPHDQPFIQEYDPYYRWAINN